MIPTAPPHRPAGMRAFIIVWLGQIISVLAWFTNPISPIIGGTLADFVLEPAMQGESGLVSLFGWLVGTGPGAGMGLLMVFCGILGVLVPVVAYASPAIRHAEALLPDHDQAAPNAARPENGPLISLIDLIKRHDLEQRFSAGRAACPR